MMTSRIHERDMTEGNKMGGRQTNACRYLLGIVFVLSSTFKWVGLRSFALTVELFCDYLGYAPLRGHGMVLAVLVCLGELLLGVAAFIPRLRRWTSWAFPVVMAYFTYITFLNHSDRYGQVESCGCFGEVIHMTPAESFWKNVLLLALSLLPLLGQVSRRPNWKRHILRCKQPIETTQWENRQI